MQFTKPLIVLDVFYDYLQYCSDHVRIHLYSSPISSFKQSCIKFFASFIIGRSVGSKSQHRRHSSCICVGQFGFTGSLRFLAAMSIPTRSNGSPANGIFSSISSYTKTPKLQTSEYIE